MENGLENWYVDTGDNRVKIQSKLSPRPSPYDNEHLPRFKR